MSRISFGVWAVVVLILVPLAGAQSYTVTDLGVLPGGTLSAPSALNDHGAVVGTCIVGFEDHAFLWTAASGMQDLGTLSGDAGSAASGINNSSEVVGSSLSNSISHAFIWTASGGMQKLGPPGANISAAIGINDSGEIVGYFYLGNYVEYHSFLRTKAGGIRDLGTLGGPDSSAEAINKSGEVAGFSLISDDRNSPVHAFLWTQADGMQDLGTLGGLDSEAYAVSASGEVFGGSNMMPNQEDQAFFWMPSGGMEALGTGPGSSVTGVNASGQLVGTFGDNRALLWTSTRHAQDLNNLIPPNSGWVLSQARAINRSGQIAVLGTINGQTHAALLTPTN